MEYRGQKFTFTQGVRLGAGGMAEVYVGTRSDDPSSHVAIKVPLATLAPDLRAAFLREAEAASRVESPYVVSVVDWGDSPPFIAFEFVEGGTLADELDRRRGAQQFWS